MQVNITGSLFVNGVQVPQVGGFSFPTTPGLPGQVIVSNGDGTTSWGNAGGSVGATVVVGTVTLQDSAGSGTWSLSLPTGPGTAGQVLQTDGTGITTWVTPSAGSITMGNLPVDAVTTTLEFLISGGGSPIQTGLQGWLPCSFPGTIQSVTLLADQSETTVQIDIWKCTYAQYVPGTHPVVGDSICASDVPTITSTAKFTDSALTGWNKTINTGDILAFNCKVAATNATLLAVSLSVLKT